MKKPVTKLSDAELLADFPIRGKTAGWFYRVTETSSNAWLVEGSDAFGRRVSRQGSEPEALLAACEADASAIVARSPGNR